MQKQSLARKTEEQLMDYISRNQLQEGAKLPTEQELMSEFHVGRNTLREAMRSLVSRNVLTVRQGSGYYISGRRGVQDDPLGLVLAGDKKRTAAELLQVRAMIEPEIAALAAQNATEDDIAALQEACDEVEREIALGESFSRSDRAFHAAVADCTHNTVIRRLVPIITEGVDRFADAVGRQEYEQTVRSHRAIVRAIRLHRPLDARREMEYHLLFNRERFAQDEE